MNSKLTFVVMTILLSTRLFSAQAQDILVDDSYTPSQRYDKNIVKFPELKWPQLEFIEGQRIVFEQRYKRIGRRELHLDIFLPAEARSSNQTIMLVHGGGWRSGNKSHLYPIANLLSQRGYVVVLPEYRLSIEATYPAGLVDLNDARLWLAEHAKEFAIDPDKIAIGGASSGGQMATLLANTGNHIWFKGDQKNAKSDFNLVVNLDGVLDFTDPLAIEYENKLGAESAAGLWFGGAMKDTLEKWQQASAARHIHAHSPPMLIVSSGQKRFTAGQEIVRKQLTEFSIDNQYYEFDTILHSFWLFEPYLSQTVQLIDNFFSKQNL
ncbi:alpha/beta hydrolase [Aliiglaciecola lipolytica]|uniref:Alpha/beta hydrolase fold-3 domain protein n=1 Tax=Aliiglaciecola lipolytica E3 TaxID=1127673 RepID=K6X1D8_9ALTE|nr:alpha/beta hydrolase [Aliiglaciecola lipolytica]GAC14469.1 alpha/beta hydrolase fold-3 domain protein [Aliiglaciecola lipolytica E3]